MSEKPSFSKIFNILGSNLQCPVMEAPLDFTIRPIKNLNQITHLQLIFTNNMGGKLHLTTCFVSLKNESRDNLNLSSEWKLLIDDKQLLSAPSTLAETLLAERMRISKQGITFYDLDFKSDSLLFINDGLMYSCYLKQTDEITNLKLLDMNNAMVIKRNPLNWKLLAYLKERNVFIIDIFDNISTQLTFSGPDIGSGCSHYVIQEEFDRIEGMWWRPNEDNEDEYHLLIEEYDESDVSKLIIPCYTFEFENEEYRYPQPGKKNAKSTLKILKIKKKSQGFDYEVLELHCDALKLLSEYEYLTNAGWTPDGKFIWIQLADRLQNCLSTYLLSLGCFYSKTSENHLTPYAVLLNKEINETFWVPVNKNTVFLKSNQTDPDCYTCFCILGQSLSGYNHLYLIINTWTIPTNNESFIICNSNVRDSLMLTSGNWEVDIRKIWINEKKNMVYFLANKDDILSNYLYGMCYKKDFAIHTITKHDTKAYLNPEKDWAVVYMSSLQKSVKIQLLNLLDAAMPKYTIFRISDPYQISFNGILVTKYPRLLKYNIDDAGSEVTLYGLLFVPDSVEQKPWPTLHYVYGGPSVRIVENNYNRNFLYFAQKINSFGFALLVCDGRGSSRRGLQFHGHVKNKMGTVELDDQIFFLQQAALETGLIDIKRVGIYGSSYGGYLTIMALFRHSNVYQCGFSCSPVVDFRFYDTAYTERYMGLPETNVESYQKASVLTHIYDLPKDKCRLIVAHGGKDENVHFLHTANLIRQATMLGHNIKFLFYPGSRHGIKDRAHLESHLIKFLQKHLID